MKKLFLSATCMLAVATCFSQEALWGGAPSLPSPDVRDDGTVTFRLNAPGASEVLITGDMLPQRPYTTPEGRTFMVPGVEKLERDSAGMWSLTVSGLAPELYCYSMFVDGVRINDPSNVYRVRDINTISDYFIVPGKKTVDYSVNEVPHGIVSKVWYPSAKMNTSRRLTVYTPAGYEANPDRRYPVLYLHHGMGGDEQAWSELGRATQILDNLIARGEAEPMIVVMPNGNIGMQAAPGETADGLRQPTTNLPHTMDGTYEEAFPEIMNFIDANYRTVPDAAHRAIAGLSMGGFHSMSISRNQPDDFDYVGLFSAAVFPREGMTNPVYNDPDGKLAAQAKADPKLYWIAIGKDDFLYDDNTNFRKKLDSMGFKYTYHESEGGHIWRNWRDYLVLFLPQLFK